ncbi:MAG: DUF1667 domain-containing protein [Thermoanaerobacteraceae bacterium]|nr:DUF1667 domain-containing protein [Thermoanaerobacteraceae bacterium]
MIFNCKEVLKRTTIKAPIKIGQVVKLIFIFLE